MAYPATQISITYSGGGPTVLTIPANASLSDFVRDIFSAGGFFTNQNAAASSPQTQTFIPSSQITAITAS
jgi:hypothetical protein